MHHHILSKHHIKKGAMMKKKKRKIRMQPTCNQVVEPFTSWYRWV